jgi:undecaprenyl-diphosphatase
LHLGSQYLAHDAVPGLPSSYVTLFWPLGLSAWATRRFAAWCLPLMLTGLLVGWSRVFLGVHFPLDILAAMPVAMVGTAAARVLQAPLLPVTVRVLYLYDLVALALRRSLTSSASVSDDSDPARPAVRRRREELSLIDRS